MQSARGFTLVELLIGIAIMALILAIAIPWYQGARRAGDEASAVSTLKAINGAQALFKSVCGAERYAPDLPSLGIPMPTTGEAFLTADLTTAQEIWKGGYVIRMIGQPIEDAKPACNGVTPAAGYAATADPGREVEGRFFATNTSRAIYEHTQSLAGKMPESGPPPEGRELGSTGGVPAPAQQPQPKPQP
jgi:prepilin-type N-terminal cleavage/methylation domain-containing protein